ncbi:MAG TPA: hypothetical protein EYH13_01510 [Thermococcus paralvinellae]|uniref:Clostripain n=1 Tax=Thermococcus paralvinellae TaxID=582419 RepID=A0A833E0I9_9EURY|nr:hypothetical protein [Thermococcus paralvinellae]
MRRGLVWILVRLLLVAVIAGCIGGEETAGEETAQTGENTETVTEEKGTETMDQSSEKVGVLFAVYMVGSDLESDGEYATLDLLEMLQALAESAENNVELLVAFGGSNKEGWRGVKYADFECLLKDWNEDQKFGNANCYLYENSNANMGDEKTLQHFLEFAGEYEVDKKILVFWDHGSAYSGYGYDEAFGNDKLTLEEIYSAFKNANVKFDIIGFDACLMANLEVANTIKSFARYMVASEEIEPGHGWDYYAILAFMSSKPKASPLEIAKIIVDSYFENPEHEPMKTLSVVDLSKVDDIIAALDELSYDLIEDLNVETFGKVGNSITKAQAFGKEERENIEVSIDLKHFAIQIKSQMPGLSDKANDLIKAIDDAIVYERHDKEKPHSYGISIFSPRNMDAFEEYKRVSASQGYLGFVGRFLGISSRDKEAPKISELKECTYENTNGYCVEVKDNLGLADVEIVYVLLLEDESMLLLGSDPAFEIGDGKFFIPEWHGEWLYISGDKEVTIVPAFYASVTEDAKIVYVAEADLTRGGSTMMVQLFLLYDPELESIETYAVPYEEVNGEILISKEVLELKDGDVITFYAPIFYEDGSEEWIEMGSITWNDETEFVLGSVTDYLLEGVCYYGLYAEDFSGNYEVSEFIEVS